MNPLNFNLKLTSKFLIFLCFYWEVEGKFDSKVDRSRWNIGYFTPQFWKSEVWISVNSFYLIKYCALSWCLDLGSSIVFVSGWLHLRISFSSIIGGHVEFINKDSFHHCKRYFPWRSSLNHTLYTHTHWKLLLDKLIISSSFKLYIFLCLYCS